MRRRVLSVALAVGLIAVSGALAARGDPQKRFTPADQARAKAMLLRKSDLGYGFKASPSSNDDGDFYCTALDESDLTLTGEAQSPDFDRGTLFVSSRADVYASVAEANASWRRGTSAAGERCLENGFRREFAKQGVRVVAFRRLAFPPLAERSIAYRLVASAQGVRVFFDVVALKQSRGESAVLVGSALEAPPKSEELRLARIVESRMKSAMR